MTLRRKQERRFEDEPFLIWPDVLSTNQKDRTLFSLPMINLWVETAPH